MTLNPRQFFHGTAADLQPGDIIQPGSGRGIRNHPQLQKWRDKHVWATPDEKGAWWYANHASDQSASPDDRGRYQPIPGDAKRARVYEVEPIGPAQRRRRLNAISEPIEHSMAQARVKRSVDIPPPENGEPVQGQLPLDKSWDNWSRTVKMAGRGDGGINDHWEWAEARHPEEWSKPSKPEKKPHEHPGQQKLL